MPQHLSIAWSEGEVAALDDACYSRWWLPTDELGSVEEIRPSSLVPKVLPGDLCAWLHGQRCVLINPHGRLCAMPLHALRLACAVLRKRNQSSGLTPFAFGGRSDFLGARAASIGALASSKSCFHRTSRRST
jgi:hypothetical protein